MFSSTRFDRFVEISRTSQCLASSREISTARIAGPAMPAPRESAVHTRIRRPCPEWLSVTLTPLSPSCTLITLRAIPEATYALENPDDLSPQGLCWPPEKVRKLRHPPIDPGNRARNTDRFWLDHPARSTIARRSTMPHRGRAYPLI